MEGGPVLPSLPDVPTTDPLETSGGISEQPTQETNESQRQPAKPKQRLNKVGRRFQLALQLSRRVPWLAQTPIARIAYAVSEVSDADWTVDEVEAWLHLKQSPKNIRRPSAVLIHRLQGAAQVWADPASRRRAAEATQATDIASQERHAESTSDFRAAGDSNVMASVFNGLDGGLRQLSEQCRANGLDDLTGLPAAAPGADADGSDWDTAAAVFAAMFGDEAHNVLTDAETLQEA
jgi:hypothetical protein